MTTNQPISALPHENSEEFPECAMKYSGDRMTEVSLQRLMEESRENTLLGFARVRF